MVSGLSENETLSTNDNFIGVKVFIGRQDTEGSVLVYLVLFFF